MLILEVYVMIDRAMCHNIQCNIHTLLLWSSQPTQLVLGQYHVLWGVSICATW